MPRIHYGPQRVEHGHFFSLGSLSPLEDIDDLIERNCDPAARELAVFAREKSERRIPTDILGVEEFDYQTVQQRECPIDRMHVTSERSTRVILTATHGGWIHPFVWGYPLTIINHWLKNRLEQSGLTGFECEALHELQEGNMEGVKEYAGQDLRLYFLPECPRDVSMKATVDPPNENACPFCSASPFVCPGCGDWTATCKGCGRHLVTRSPDDLTEHPFLIDDDDWLIDVSKWNGQDFLGDVVTRRVVEFLLSIHAEPFVALPVRANTLNITPEKRRRLEESKRIDLLQ